jgi:hypothetical protein
LSVVSLGLITGSQALRIRHFLYSFQPIRDAITSIRTTATGTIITGRIIFNRSLTLNALVVASTIPDRFTGTPVVVGVTATVGALTLLVDVGEPGVVLEGDTGAEVAGNSGAGVAAVPTSIGNVFSTTVPSFC